MKKQSLIIAIIIIVTATGLWAVSGNRHQCFDEIKTMRQDVITNTIIPQKTIWKEKIDKVISAEDKVALDKLRDEANQLHLAVVQNREEMSDSLIGRGRGYRRAMRNQLRETNQSQRHAIVSNVKAIMAKYETLNTDIVAEKQKLNTELYANRCESRKEFAENNPDCVRQFEKRISGPDADYMTRGRQGKHHQGRRHSNHRQIQHSEISMVAIWLYDGSQSK